MDRFLLALALGLFSHTATPGSLTSAALVPVVAAVDPAREAAQEQADRERLAKAPVTGAVAERARQAVREEREQGENGRVTHRFTFPDGAVVEFNDRPRGTRDQARRDRVLSYTGTQAASAEPNGTFDAAGKTFGLSPAAVSALRFISRHEGGFDAINTWDAARFSWGFIQFAGGYGLRPMLGYLKARSPDLFQQQLADYGIDVLPDAAGRPEPVLVEANGKTLRGAEAEQAFGDRPLLIALFIRAGRLPEVKQRQVEAAIRDYALPALRANVASIQLTDALRSPQSLAMLIDRQVQEGSTIRLQWALQHASIVSHAPNPADWRRLEGQALDLAVQDADARALIREQAEAAADQLAVASTEVRGRDRVYLLDGTTLTAAREAMTQALIQAQDRMVVSWRRDALSQGFSAALASCDPAQVRDLSGAECAAELERLAGTVRGLVSGLRYDYAVRNRLRDIRTSSLAGP